MNRMQVHEFINKIISVLYRAQFWSHENEETVWQRRLKLFYSIYYVLYSVSLLQGAFASENREDSIFLIEAALIIAVVHVRLLYLIWRKTKILELLNQICIYFVDDQNTFVYVNNKHQRFVTFMKIFLGCSYFAAVCSTIILPLFSTERTLFFKIGFPLDWQNNEFAYWAAFIFIVTESIIANVAVLFSVLFWYLFFQCGLRYVVLGEKFKTLGAVEKPDEVSMRASKRKVTDIEKENIFRRDLHDAIGEHQSLTELTHKLIVFPKELLVVQLSTSGLCICFTVYHLAFNLGDNLLDIMVHLIISFYHIFDIFMVTYLGNEITLASDRLSYSLFESNWMDRSETIKKDIIIFGEFLMKPVELVILKLYSLTLDTFTKILNAAYNMFNILKNFK